MAEQTLMVPAYSTAALLRQGGLLVGIAASVALGVWVVLWAQAPNYSLLYSSLSDRDVNAVMDALQATEIQYKMDHRNGAVLVESGKVHDARLKLAAAGLPKSAGIGFEMLDEDQGFGTSQFIENARFQRALEGELSRSIARVSNVRSARVHLAMPKPSAFIRERRPPSASVLVDLYPGRRLESEQVAAIAHLVSASVPNLSMADVTVVDQSGHLLTSGADTPEMMATTGRFEHTERIERSYAKRIEDILAPIVGHDGVKAQVTAELDYTAVEQTRESFNPDLPAMRSEQTMEEQRVGGSESGGVPGALSNQPPANASAPEQAVGAGSTDVTSDSGTQNVRRQATRNYELDKTISHTRMQVGEIRRLSVAVVVNNRPGVNEEGEAVLMPLNEEELSYVKTLVKEAIGFDAVRGDTVNVINTEFSVPLPAEPLPEPPIWQQPWVWNIGKQVLGGIFVLFVLLGVIRPTVTNLLKKQPAVAGAIPLADGSAGALPVGAMEPTAQAASQGTMSQLAAPSGDLDSVRSTVAQDPKLAAQVVKGWVGDE